MNMMLDMLVYLKIYVGVVLSVWVHWTWTMGPGVSCLPGFASTWIHGTRRFTLKSFVNTSIYSYLYIYIIYIYI